MSYRKLSRKISTRILALIVGLGRTEFLRCVNDPALIVKRMNDGAFKESFSYCLPSREDQEMCNVYTHISSASQYLGSIFAKELFSEPYAPEVQADLKQIKLALGHMAMARVQEFLNVETSVLKLVARHRVLLGVHHGIDNLYNDVNLYKRFFREL